MILVTTTVMTISFLFFKILQQNNFKSFQAVCIIVAFLSWLLMRYTGMNVEVAVDASASGSGGNQGIFYPFDPLRVSSC